MPPGRWVPTSLIIEFLEKKGFIRRASDPFFCTYVRGKSIISLDPEAPDMDLVFLGEDIRQMVGLEQPADDFLVELQKYVQQKRGTTA